MATGPKTKFAKLLAKKTNNDTMKRGAESASILRRATKKGNKISKKILKQF